MTGSPALADPPTIGNLEAESELLGALMIDNRMVDQVADTLAAEDFCEPLHGRLYAAITALVSAGKKATPVTLKPLFERDPAIVDMGGPAYLADLTQHSGGLLAGREFAQQIRELAIIRRMNAALRDAVTATENLGDATPAEIAEAADVALGEALLGTSIQTPGIGLGKLFTRSLGIIESEARGDAPKGVQTRLLPDMHEIADLLPGTVTVLAGRPGMGKAQPLDAKVLTAAGWMTMGQLQVGDELASHDGRPSKVTGIFPQGEKQIFRVTLSDGRSTECCDEHLWRVYYRDWDAPKVITTARLREMVACVRYKNRLWIDMVTGDFGNKPRLPIDPWFLGAYLGNGQFGAMIRFSTNDPDTVARVAAVVGSDNLVFAGRYDWRIRDQGKMRRALVGLGIGSAGSTEKFVPECYLTADRETRLAVLQGLMDTDGWAEKHGTIRYGTSSRQLADDVRRLVMSLGGQCSIAEKTPGYTYRGERRVGQTTYICRIRHNHAESLFSLARKAERAVRQGNVCRLNVASVEPTRIAAAQCISVDHPDHLYVTDDYIVTHNTAASLSTALGACQNGHGVAYFSLEMKADQLGKRMISDLVFEHGNSASFNDIKRGKFTAEDYRRIRAAEDMVADWPFEIIDQRGVKIGRIAMMIRRLKRQFAARGHSLDLVVIDYLQLVKPDRARGSRYEEVGEISRTIKEIAGELGIAILLLAQVNRECEKREDKRPQPFDLRDAGDIEQDADTIVFLYRDEHYLKLSEPTPDKPGYEAWLSKMDAARDRIEIYAAKRRDGETMKRLCHFFLANQAVRGSRYFEGRR